MGARRADAGVAITGIGLRTAVGDCAAQSYTSVRAGINRFQTWPVAGGGGDAEDGAATVSSIVGEPAGDWAERARLLAIDTVQEALFDAALYTPADLQSSYGRNAIAALVALPSADRAGVGAASLSAFEEGARTHCIVELQAEDVGFLPHDHAAGVMALARAGEKLRSGEVDVAVVVGVDCLLVGSTLQGYLAAGKLKTDTQPSGLIAGEGAAVLVLEREAAARKRGAAIYGLVDGTATAREEIPFDGPDPTRAEGLGEAMHAVLADRDPAAFGDVLTDLNGERGRFQEWGLIEVRCLHVLQDGWRRHHPADCVGDLGAATGVFLLAVGAGLLRWGHALRGGVLVSTASPHGERACAALVQAATEEGK